MKLFGAIFEDAHGRCDRHETWLFNALAQQPTESAGAFYLVAGKSVVTAVMFRSDLPHCRISPFVAKMRDATKRG